VKVDIDHHPDARQIVAVAEISSIGRVNICSVRSNATTITRSPKLARDEMDPSIFLGLQISGCSMVIQDGREATLHPGDMAIYDTTRPYTLLNERGIHQHYFRIPRRDLALPDRTLSDISAVRLGPANPIAVLAATYLGRLARMQEPLESVRGAGTIAMPTIELVRALIATSVCDTALAAEPLQRTLEPRIVEYMQTHLAESDLTATRIAAQHNVSVRQLYKILGRSGITPADWIRARRLEESRNDLRNPALHHLTIETIARRRGLTDPTHFSRAFKTAYGVSPSQWRAQKQQTHPLPTRAGDQIPATPR
jgi:AraC-like DNA-binding protein